MSTLIEIWAKLCNDVPNFVTLSHHFRNDRKLSFEEMGYRLHYDPKVVKKKLDSPDWDTVYDVQRLAKALECDEIEAVQLINAYLCYWFTHFRSGGR